MADSGLQSLNSQATSAYARADVLAAPIRPVSPAKSGSQFDLGQVVRPPVQSVQGDAGEDKAPKAKAFPPIAPPARGGALVDGTSAFQVQLIAQQDAEGGTAKSAFLTGSQAYARQNDAAVAGPAAAEILTQFPRLASGRTLDLSV